MSEMRTENVERLTLIEPVVYTTAEVAEHDTLNDCWIVYKGRVFDVTLYLKVNKHPAGNHEIIEWAGQDCTAAFDQAGHPKTAIEELETFFVGYTDKPIEQNSTVINKSDRKLNRVPKVAVCHWLVNHGPRVNSVNLTTIKLTHHSVAWVGHNEYGLNPEMKWGADGHGKLHYFVMAIFSTFAGFGCLVFRLFPSVSKKNKLWLHAISLTIAFIAAVIGTADKWQSRKNRTHVYTMHALGGFIFTIAFGIQLATGFIFFLKPFNAIFERYFIRHRRRLLYWHIVLGFVIFAAIAAATFSGIVEVAYSYSKDVYKYKTADAKTEWRCHVANSMGYISTAYAILVGAILFNDKWNGKLRVASVQLE